MPFHIVLVEPEIPANTGNIARTCAATGTVLHLVKPLGFSTDDRQLKRAGLDYWPSVTVHYHDSFADLKARHPGAAFHFATTKAARLYTDVRYRDGDFLVFGKETKGLPDDILDAHRDRLIRIPMAGSVRSLNLSNAAAVVLFEALRQNRFFNLN